MLKHRREKEKTTSLSNSIKRKTYLKIFRVLACRRNFRRRASWTLGKSKWNSSWHNWTIRYECCWF